MRDVLIVGGGPVGTMLGCLLALRGLDVQVLERRTEPSLRSRAIGIHPPLLGVLEQVGVAEALVRRATHVEEGSVRCDGRTLGRLSFSALPTPYPYVAMLPQYETESLLRERFQELRPGGLRGGVSVSEVRRRHDYAEVVTDAGETFQARYVVGADGARSRVRESAGLPWLAVGGRETYLMCDYGDTGIYGADAVLYFERGGVVESFPLPDGTRRWVAMTDFLAEHASSSDLADVVRHRTGAVVGQARGVASAFEVQQHRTNRMVAGRVLLVGDAAHQISPIGGQGMNLGWLEAAALAPALARAVAEGDAAASALAMYSRTRMRAARMAMRQAGFNMSMGRPVRGLRLQARNALVRTLAVPPTSALVARAFTMRWL
ncbi:hypothetical protein GY21_04520 [Cryobacterium roopkundense]|uniref:2-polyprenyl-6-methoxyphenol hydroxylase-like FAD-dependent oxidoreductase n=1 Tax=Cryobacterium roopkundense TaxID=1001240 RepID=A0A099JPT3_9MICO|nr:NAD(P)/FAD-dependent oxidoreductase [Cryobacterium roopkundense]KGJ79607.1 hypothetical protein GY21_04520 [Cryobacterium roopkundense]MBB5639823.1 2-polyprenyl-6-methoxyphenol hydroxylase-like FAD-dependent oxidoreductase [Cryobacterium roopkundense]